MSSFSPIRRPSAGNDPLPPHQGRDTAGSGAAGMTAASGSAMEWIAHAESREQVWLGLERDFQVLAAKFGGLSMFAVVALIFLPLDALFASTFGLLFCWCLVNAAQSSAEASDCRDWYQSWVVIRDELHASLAEAT